MSPYARPDTDTHVGNYEDEAAGTTDIYESIDETSPSDVDYIISPAAPSSEPYVCALSTVTDPKIGTGHVIRFRYAKSLALGNQIDLVVQLRQGYVSEGSLGTLIKAWTYTDISDTLTTAEETLSEGEADAITNYSDLFLRFVFNEV